jgi:SAM-dependent methyltransferase
MTERAHTNRLRAESFGALAEQYDRERPRYPDALIDDLVAGHPADALDVGCGTGKAAVLLAARGVDVLGVEVDERMSAVARRRGVPVEIAPFETWPARGRRFDLVVCGQAWHWIDPAVGPMKAKELLRAEGLLGLFWNFAHFDAEARRALDAAYADAAPELSRHSVVRGGGPATLPAHIADLRAAGLGALEHRRYEWFQDYSRDGWLRLVATHSDHATLPAARRAALSARLAQAIGALGGTLRARYVTEALLARRG